MPKTGDTNPARKSSDALHNENCYHYLRYLLEAFPKFLCTAANNPGSNSPNLNMFEYLNALIANGLFSIFSPTYAYGNLYHSLIPFLQDHIEVLNDRENPEENEELHEFIYRIFANDNGSLIRTHEAISDVIAAPSNRPLEKRVTEHMADDGALVNERHPIIAGSAPELLRAAVSSDYRPMRDNIPSILPFMTPFVQLRFSTMAEKVDAFRINPLFARWLKVLEARGWRHLYINHLAWDRPGFDPEGEREVAMSGTLHQNMHPNCPMITLPADKGLMGSGAYTHTHRNRNKNKIFDDFLKIAKNSHKNSPDNEVRDFHIPEDLSNAFFTEAREKEESLRKLLKKSFKECGLIGEDIIRISPAEVQAVWVYFINFALTDFIIEKLMQQSPGTQLSINISCKDAIDRGGLASAVFNLMYSLKRTHTPLTREQFEMLVDAPAAMVKGRGMNHHRNRLWNMMDVWVNANFMHLSETPNLQWIIAWRDDNCPIARVEDVFARRIDMAQQQINSLAESVVGKEALRNVLTHVATLHDKGISDRRLLLRVISASFALVHGADEKTHANYEKLIQRISIDSRLGAAARLLSGAMKVLLGVVSFSKQRIEKGVSTFRSGFYHAERKALTEGLRTLKAESQPVAIEQAAALGTELADNDSDDEGTRLLR